MAKGLFITIDGPNGVGKSTVIERLNENLTKSNHKVKLTREPTNTPLGNFIRESEEYYYGKTLAYLIAADREYHIESEIKPAIERGEIIISDRYVCSSLALQRLDGLDLDFIWNLNKDFIIPDLTVILTAKNETLNNRLLERSRFSRFERTKTRLEELEYFKDASVFLQKFGYNILTLENNNDKLEICVQKINQFIQNLSLRPARA